MAEPISIDIDDRVSASLGRLIQAIGPQGLPGALSGIGEQLAASTKRRFVTSTAPDGSPWPANTEATLLALLGRRDGKHHRKDGRINAAGAATVANKRPLVLSGLLADTIVWQLGADGTSVEVGTDRFADAIDGGAAVHQFGSRDGRIPARPFLGVSADDERSILEVLGGYLAP